MIIGLSVLNATQEGGEGMTEYKLVTGNDRNEIVLARGSRQGMENVRELVQRGNPNLRLTIKEAEE